MGLSRLDNFLKSVRGTIIYVDPNSLDSTDSIENQGSSLTRPFKTIQRALIEASRFSYQRGLNNDRFGKTTILLYPGDHNIDNRPGWIPDGANNFRLRNSLTSNDFSPFDLLTSFDLTDPNNQLYKLNSIHGGVIVPRGTSLVGLDLRKTKIRPLYVPNPINDNIEKSTVFRVTGACYFWQFSFFDADPNGNCYVDYTSNQFVPNFSHHKLTCFEYADGVNPVVIDDEFQSYSTDRTDLEMYYEKVGLAYGPASGRGIEPDYPSSSIDIQPKIDEYRIVGSTGETVGISSIKAGDGSIATKIITVTTTAPVLGLDVDTPFRISGISAAGYNGQFVVSEKTSSTQIIYQVQNAPISALPSSVGATLSLNSDTVTSASPYIFNISLRSVFGMCGMLVDGSKATGFKSMVVAQFTGIGIQKDDNAFVLYDETTGTYQDSTVPGNETLSTNSRAIFKPEYRNFHIKAINDGFIQNVSIFAIGYAEQFLVESGGDMSITNSNSNFGAKALVADGFRKNAFPQDDQGYITHIIPPKELSRTEISIEFNAIDVASTISVGSTGRLYLYNQNNLDLLPENILEGYRIGARENDNLKVIISSNNTTTEHNARIVMSGSQTSSEKNFYVNQNNVGINSITNNIITLKTPHTFTNGESIRILSSSGQLPDGIISNNVYYAITSGIGTNQIKIAKTQNDAVSLNELDINSKGGILNIVSRVSDKNPGEISHPIQFDTGGGINQWYINVSTASTENTIYSTVVGLGTTVLGSATPRTYINRLGDNRNVDDIVYKVRYIIPAGSSITARPPSDGFIIQESNSTSGLTNAEIQTYFGNGSITNINQQRNFKFISNATWSSNVATITTELPHNLSVGSEVEILKVRSTNNTAGTINLGFNGTYIVTTTSHSKQFTFSLTNDPGTFTSDTTSRTTTLPHFKRKKFNNTYIVYRSQEIQKYISGSQDGIYYLILINSSNRPSISPFTNENFPQPAKDLYPQTNRDNPKSDPEETKSFATSSLIGEVIINDVRNSLTKETINKTFKDFDIGIGITDIRSSSATSHTIHTSLDHGLNRVTQVSIANSGIGYGNGTANVFYGVSLVGFAGSTTGQHATAKISVNSSGTITDIKIMDGGSSYGIGNTLTLSGIGTTSGFSQAVINVSKIYNNIGDVVKISGVTSTSYQDYNNLYRINAINVGSAKSFTVVSASDVLGFSSTVGATLTSDALLYFTGESILISALTYDNVTGKATITTLNRHGLKSDNKIRITGANQSLYNGSFIVSENVGLNTFSVRIGVSTSAPAVTGTLFAYRDGLTSNGGVITRENENLNGRMLSIYAGITTTLSSLIPDATTDQINILNIANLDINIGDYLTIDDEIVRVKTNVPSTPINPIYVFRGVLGTRAVNHINNSVIRKIKINPIELRRHSIMRASGHTFEYVGFGPGNYSTAFPDRQDRDISPQEELLAQSTRRSGGINFYTGMNDKGISYAGNKKQSTITGQEEIFDTPIQTITGEDIGNLSGLNIISPLEGNFSRSIRVEGGTDSNVISEFNGPVVFSEKITSTSSSGIEANSLFLQGNATVSRKYTVGISTPILAGNAGDVVYYDSPTRGGYIGWVYTTNNDWQKFAPIQSGDRYVGIWSGTFIGDGAGLFNVDSIWDIDAIGIHTTKNVGIGTTTAKSEYKLYVDGNTQINGTLNVYEVIEKATISAGILTATSVTNIDLAENNVYYFTNTSQGNWIFNFRGNSSQTLNNFLVVGDSITVAILTTQGATAYYNAAIRIDGVTIVPKYYGGISYTTGNQNSIDVYTYVIIKTASNTYSVLSSQSQYT